MRKVISALFRCAGTGVFFSIAVASWMPASAQQTAPDRCLALAWNTVPVATSAPVLKTRLQLAALKPYQVRVTYHGHSTFTIESPKGVTIATDYNDYVRPTDVPTIATMNVAHDTHHSYAPDKNIRHVLRGWNPDGDAAAIHDLTVEDARVRNVPTNIRSSYGGPPSGRYGNSIFVFEIGGLCIAHLGHLHHTLTTQQLAQIGQMDVVFVPVDGSYTLDMPGTLEVLKALKAPIVVPMHWFSGYSLEAFVDAAKGDYEIVRNASPSIVFARDQMPPKPQILVMPPGG
ncbi:MAG: MBL fold metallo-hydrolase [Alphaproteobacteria bacterium]|nr:MBL fold metallo-hydrolase [Alphaproteobacteria bacterium]